MAKKRKSRILRNSFIFLGSVILLSLLIFITLNLIPEEFVDIEAMSFNKSLSSNSNNADVFSTVEFGESSTSNQRGTNEIKNNVNIENGMNITIKIEGVALKDTIQAKNVDTLIINKDFSINPTDLESISLDYNYLASTAGNSFTGRTQQHRFGIYLLSREPEFTGERDLFSERQRLILLDRTEENALESGKIQISRNQDGVGFIADIDGIREVLSLDPEKEYELVVHARSWGDTFSGGFTKKTNLKLSNIKLSQIEDTGDEDTEDTNQTEEEETQEDNGTTEQNQTETDTNQTTTIKNQTNGDKMNDDDTIEIDASTTITVAIISIISTIIIFIIGIFLFRRFSKK